MRAQRICGIKALSNIKQKRGGQKEGGIAGGLGGGCQSDCKYVTSVRLFAAASLCHQPSSILHSFVSTRRTTEFCSTAKTETESPSQVRDKQTQESEEQRGREKRIKNEV